MSKHRIFVLMIILSSTLAMVGGAGQAVASPKQGATNGVHSITEWRTEYVDQSGDAGAHASIAFDPGNGTPWISYYDADNTALKVAHYKGASGNCGYGNEWFCETVDNADSVGTSSSIDVYPNNGPYPLNTRRVGVAYYDATHAALKFAEYSCFTTCAWDIVTVRNVDNIFAPSFGEYASMKYNNAGNPLIAYTMSSAITFDEVDYAYQVTSGGNCGEGSAAEKWNCETVDAGNDVGLYPSLDYSEFSGVYIAYYHGGGFLKYAYPIGAGLGNCGTDTGWYCIFVDGIIGDDVGKWASIHAPDDSGDVLQFAYYEEAIGRVKYAKYVSGGGGNCGMYGFEGDFQCDFIEIIGTGPTHAGISLGMDSNGYPIVAYMDDSNSLGWPILKVARPIVALGIMNGNCGHEVFPEWKCSAIDSGSIHQEEAEYASIAIDLDGLATIAYSEQVTGPSYNWYNLKIAKQREALFLPVVMK